MTEDRLGVESRFAVVPEWVFAHPSLSHTAVRVYAVLAMHASADNAAWPSRRTLADAIGASVDSIDRALKALREAKVLTVESRYDDDTGRQTSNRYLLRVISASGGRTVAAPLAAQTRPPGAAPSRPQDKEQRKNPTAPASAYATAEGAVVKWCEITGMKPTRYVLKSFIPAAAEYIAAVGEPSDELLRAAARQGIKTPKGWGFVQIGEQGGPINTQVVRDPGTCRHRFAEDDGDPRGRYCFACRKWESELEDPE